MNGRRRGDHVYFIAAALLASAVVAAGFAPTFYLRGWFPEIAARGPELGPLLVAHALVFTSWLVVLLVQVALVAAGRTDLHRQLGMAGAAIAAAMVVLGPMVAVQAVHRGRMPISFLAIPIGDMLVFGILVAAAIWKRRKSETHKRLMLTATIAILPAAVARLPFDFLRGPLEVFGLTDLLLVACVAIDVVRRRRLHPAFLWGGLLLIASHPLRLLLRQTQAWQTFAGWLVGAA